VVSIPLHDERASVSRLASERVHHAAHGLAGREETGDPEEPVSRLKAVHDGVAVLRDDAQDGVAAIGLRTERHPGILCGQERTVTIAFQNLTVRTSLNAICESSGLRWSLEASEPPFLRIECQDMPVESLKPMTRMARAADKRIEGANKVAVLKPEKEPVDRLEIVLSIDLESAPLDRVLDMAARLLDARLVLDASLRGETVTLSLDKVTVRRFLDAVAAQARAEWGISKDAPRTLTIGRTR
jgi:hypothetical protein